MVKSTHGINNKQRREQIMTRTKIIKARKKSSLPNLKRNDHIIFKDTGDIGKILSQYIEKDHCADYWLLVLNCQVC